MQNKEQRSYHLTVGLSAAVVITVILVVMVVYYQHEAEQRMATVAKDLIAATHALDELEQRNAAIIGEGTASAEKAATTQAKDAQVNAEQATTIAEQATTVAEQTNTLTKNDVGRAEQQARMALARQLAAAAELVVRDGGGESLSLGALLAIESVKRYPTVEGNHTLRNALSLMPRLQFQLTKEGVIKQMAFDPNDRRLAAAHAFNKAVTVWDLATGKEITSLAHDAEVSGVAFDPTGNLIATTAADGTARLWKTDTWQQIARLEHDANNVEGVTFDPKGTRLATRSGKTIYIWDVSTGKEIMRLEHNASASQRDPVGDKNFVRDMAFSPYGKWIATTATVESGEGTIVWIWDAETGEEVTRLKHSSIVEAMAFSPYGKWLATASGNTAVVWEVNTGRKATQVMHQSVVNDVAFSPDSTLLATGSRDNTARLWEIATGRERMQWVHKDEVVSLDFSSDGASLATGSEKGLAQVWDVATGQKIARMEHPDHPNQSDQMEDVAFSPDGRRLATRHRNGNVIYVWDLSPDGPEMLRFRREDSINAVAFSMDGTILASGNSDGSLQVWDTATWKEITPKPMKHESEIKAIALNADSSLLASAARDGAASVWNVATGKELIRVKSMAQYANTTDVTLSPDSQLLATSSNDNTTRLWNVATGLEVARATYEGVIWNVDFSSNGKYLASAGDDGVKVLEAPDWKEVAMLRHQGANDIAFSPDETLLASAGRDDMARVWDTSTWQEVVHMKHNDQYGVVSAVAFSPDGRKLATGSGSAITRVWDTTTWEEIARIPGSADPVLFSPDGRWLLTWDSQLNAVRVWDTSIGGSEVARIEHTLGVMALSPNGRLLATASRNDDNELLVTTWQPDDLTAKVCSRLGRNLAWNEWRQYMSDEPYSETCPGLPIPASSFEDVADHIKKRLCRDDTDVAPSLYKSAASLALLSNDKSFVDNVCRYGLQERFAEIVLPACERAVELDPNETYALDSRGIARALTGDFQGALEDLKSGVEALENEGKYAEFVAQRRQIIGAIEKEQDVDLYIEGCQEFAAMIPTPNVKTPTPSVKTPPPNATPIPQPEVVLQPTEVIRSFVADVDRVVIGRPGEIVSYTLTVTNTGNITASYDIWAQTGDSYNRYFSLPELGYGSDTLDYSGKVGVIGPGDSIQTPIKVSIPDSATGNQFEATSLLVQDGYAPSVSMQMVTAVSYTTAIEQVGRVGLDARDVFVKDDYAYIAAGMEGLRILAVSDALHPVEVGSYKIAEGALGQVESVQVVGDYAYLVTNLSGIRIINVSNPAAPVEVGDYRPGGSIQALKLAGDYAYVIRDSCTQRCLDQLRIVDISDPTAPVEVSNYSRSLERNNYKAGDKMNDVAIMGNYAYIFLPDEMRVLDISDPTNPVEIDSYEKMGHEVIEWGDYAYSYDEKQVKVVDISNPKLVVEVGVYNVPDIINMSQVGGRLYVATKKDDVYIFDLTIPSSLAPVSLYTAPGNREIGGAAAKENYVYLAAGSAGLQIVDISNLTAPKKAGVYGAPASVIKVALAEGYVYAADRYNGLRILDLAAGPAAPTEVGSYHKPGTGALDVAVDEGYAYVILGPCEQGRYSGLVCYGDLRVLDMANPAAPVEVGVYNGGWHKVEVAGDYAFVVGETTIFGDKPFHILDISNPAAPKQVAAYDAIDFTLADGYLYLLSDEKERLTILDIATLKEVSAYNMPEHPQDIHYSREIAVAGDYAYILENRFYVTGSGSAWQVMNVSNPAAPIGVDVNFKYKPEYQSWGEPAAVVYDGHTFLAAKSSGLRVLDVTGVDTPTEIDAFGAVGSVMDVAVDDEGYLYVASDRGGLYVLRYAGN